jgi:hypothetical protein
MAATTIPTTTRTLDAKVVTPEEWLSARKDLLAKEKEFTRLRDELARERFCWRFVALVCEGDNFESVLSKLAVPSPSRTRVPTSSSLRGRPGSFRPSYRDADPG